MEAVARESGLSYETVRGYENGRRTPTRESLLRVLAPLRLPAARANAILADAGFAPEGSLYGPDTRPGFAFRVDELQRVIDKRPWPAMATDDAVQIVAANRAIQAVWGFDFGKERRRHTPQEMHMLAVGGRHKFFERIVNWQDTFRASAELTKGQEGAVRWNDPVDEVPAPIIALAGGDPERLRQITRIWRKAKPMPARTHVDIPVVWLDAEYGEMRFRSVISVASERELLQFRDWHPVDAETWHVLELVKARWAARRSK